MVTASSMAAGDASPRSNTLVALARCRAYDAVESLNIDSESR